MISRIRERVAIIRGKKIPREKCRHHYTSTYFVVNAGAVRYCRACGGDPCDHKNATTWRWLDADDTPMMNFHCPDCGNHDTGHVYADADTWLTDQLALEAH